MVELPGPEERSEGGRRRPLRPVRAVAGSAAPLRRAAGVVAVTTGEATGALAAMEVKAWVTLPVGAAITGATLTVLGAPMPGVAATTRFHELARIVPHGVLPARRTAATLCHRANGRAVRPRKGRANARVATTGRLGRQAEPFRVALTSRPSIDDTPAPCRGLHQARQEPETRGRKDLVEATAALVPDAARATEPTFPPRGSISSDPVAAATDEGLLVSP